MPAQNKVQSIVLALLLVGGITGCLWDSRTLPTNTVWVRQFGSGGSYRTAGVAVDGSGNVYVTGAADIQEGVPLPPAGNAFIRKFDGSGNELWARQFSDRSHFETAHGVAVDGAGNAYIVGETQGTLPGQVSYGSSDAFLAEYDMSGNELWAKQFGTRMGDVAFAVATNGLGNVYVVGSTNYDAFIRKYDPSGVEIWARVFGREPADDAAFGVAVDGLDNVYVVGEIDGVNDPNASLPSYDAFLSKFDSSGVELWTQKFKTGSSDIARGVALTPTGDIFVVGGSWRRNGNYSQAYLVGFVRKCDPSGGLLWSREFGEQGWVSASNVATTEEGAAYVVATGTIHGGYVKKYDPLGNELWTQMVGRGSPIGLAARGNEVYVAGDLRRSRYGVYSDAFVMKLVGEPDGESKEQWIWTATWVEDLLLGGVVLGLAALGLRIGKKIFRRRRKGQPA